MNITKEKSQEQADLIKPIQPLVLALDPDYLKEVLKKMKDQHAHNQSAMILHPTPIVGLAESELFAAKIAQIELYIEIANNARWIVECQSKLDESKQHAEQLKNIFKA